MDKLTAIKKLSATTIIIALANLNNIKAFN